jgi:hypothetical protein
VLMILRGEVGMPGGYPAEFRREGP